MMVFVLDKNGEPLDPCSEREARLLLQNGRAAIHRLYPFTIRLKDRTREDSRVHPLILKLDPGSKVTGVALVREESTSDGPIHRVIHLAEIEHRGDVVHDLMLKRAAYRRRRRNANLRYRAPRFDNRRRVDGWLPPSLRSRVNNVISWVMRYCRWAPISGVWIESVKFDTQKLQNPEISGVEYQRGTLFGYEVREYLLEKFGHKCAYCEAEDVPLEIDHIVPRSRGGSDRIDNLVVACRKCNQKKGNKTAKEFGHPEVQDMVKVPLKDAAAVNATRNAIVRELCALGLGVRLWTGGRTKWNRERFGIPKTHALDAACVGDIAGVADWQIPVLKIKAMGRGKRQRTNTDAYGFPRRLKNMEREKPLMRCKFVHGFRTGDLVRVEVPSGKNAGTHFGRVVVRERGLFRVGKVDGISWKHCRLIQRCDGYSYTMVSPDKNFIREE